MIKKVDHLVITTAHPAASLNFYERLGFTVQDAGSRYELFAGDFKINVHILGKELLPHAEKVQPGSADLCFEIDGAIDTFKRKIQKAGLEIELGTVIRTGVKGTMQSVYLRDPDGNLVEFCSYQ